MKISRVVRALRARPVALLAALLMCASIGSVVLVGCGGGSAPSSGETPATTTGGAAGTDGGDGGGNDGGTMAAGPVDGAKLYADRCALCHGATGHGDGPASAALNPKPRNHTDGAYMNAQSDEALLKVIHEGKGAMPPWGAVLSDEEIEAVLKHVRSLAEPPYPG